MSVGWVLLCKEYLELRTGFEPVITWMKTRGPGPLDERSKNLVALPGIEPRLSPYKEPILPLNYSAIVWWSSEVTILLSSLPLVFRRRFYRPLAGMNSNY